MDQRIKILFLCLFAVCAFAYDPEERAADAMIQARKFYLKKDWPGIIKIARSLYLWGENLYVEKCLQMAEPLVAAKNSYSGALQLADLYQKINKQDKQDYWLKVYQRITEERKRKWKKN